MMMKQKIGVIQDASNFHSIPFQNLRYQNTPLILPFLRRVVQQLLIPVDYRLGLVA